jgi:hypothetical protein
MNRKIEKHDKIMAEIGSLQENGRFPTIEEIGPPNNEPFAKVAKDLVERASVYASIKALGVSPPTSLEESRRDTPKNPLIATSLIFTMLIDRCLKGDETAKIAICLLAHLQVQLSPAIDVAMSMSKVGGGVKDGDILERIDMTVKIIDRVKALTDEGMNNKKAYKQVSDELGLSPKKVRYAFEGRKST